MKYIPPPTRHMTFFLLFAVERPIVSRRQVTTFRASWFENAYCAFTSSFSLGGAARAGMGGSTRSTCRLCGNAFTIAATSTSSGSFRFCGTYFGCVCAFSKLGVYVLPARDEEREGAWELELTERGCELEGVKGRCGAEESRKLEGGQSRGRTSEGCAGGLDVGGGRRGS